MTFSIDSEPVGQAKTDENGRGSLKYCIPDKFPLGEHELLVTNEPKGRYRSARGTAVLTAH